MDLSEVAIGVNETVKTISQTDGKVSFEKQSIQVTTSQVTGLDDKISELDTHISSTKKLIPDKASETNQLADKDFVNSSIATNTATFIGTFDSTSDLPTTGVTNNDYAYIKIVDEITGLVKQYDRYKYVAAIPEWKLEYTLNNSSFTAEQWAAIESGVTATWKESIDTHTTNSAVVISKYGLDKDTGNISLDGTDNLLLNKQTLTSILDGKVSTKTGYDLSKNDFTDTLLAKLNGIEEGANKYVLPDDVVHTDDLKTKLSQFTNDGDGTEGSKFATEGYVGTNGGKIDKIQINGTTQTITNKVVNLPAYPTTLPASDTTSTYSATGTAPVNGIAVKAALDTLNLGDAATKAVETDSKLATTGALPTTDAVKLYVTNNGGKIDTIKINGVEQTITDKVVDLPAYPSQPSDVGAAAASHTHTVSDISDIADNYQAKDVDLTAIAGLTGTSGLLKKTATNTWALDTTTYVDTNDERLSNKRDPNAHTHVESDITGLSDDLGKLAPKASPTFTGTVTMPFTSAGLIKTTSSGVLSVDTTSYQKQLSTSNKLSTDYISGLSTVATSNNYSDLDGLPTIPSASVSGQDITIDQTTITVPKITYNSSTKVLTIESI